MFTSLMHQSVLMECCLSSRVFFSHEETSYLYDRTGLGPKNGPAILGHGGPPLLFIAHMEESNHVKKKIDSLFHCSQRLSSWERWCHNSHPEVKVDVKETLLETSFRYLMKYAVTQL